jgi:hypothetical protein
VLYPHGFAATTFANEPLRGWNTGFACDVPPAQNDVEFIRYTVAASSATEPDIGGGNDALKSVFQQPGNPANPEVTVYRAPVMAHAGFTSSSNRYFDAAVWGWFKLHPRV